MGNQENQPVCGAGKIVGVKGREIGTHPDVPGVGEASSVFELLHEFIHERSVLVIHIRPKKTVVSKGKNPSLDKNPDHDDDRYEKGEEKGGFLQPGGFLS